MNYEICGRRTALTWSDWLQNLGQHVYQIEVQNVNDLRHHLIDVWAGVEQSVIGDSVDQWRRCFHACIGATGGHFNYSLWHILVKKLLTVIKLKFIVEQDICFRLSLVLWHLFSQGSVAMHLRCGGIFSDYFIIVYFWVDDDFFFKLINILQGLQSRVGCRVFVTHEVVVSTVE